MSIRRLVQSSVAARLILLAASTCAGACAAPISRPSVAPSNPPRDALLILPGFGYSQSGEHVLRSLAPVMAREGVDLFVPTYVARGGLDESRTRLDRFIHEHRLDRYQRLHVFAFIAGAWTFNPLMDAHQLPNLASVVYDRSPLQERAPAIAADKVRLLAWVRYGSTLFDVAKTPYPPLAASNVKVGLIVESRPTPFIRKHERAARQRGPFQFECGALRQRYDDCLYIPMNHDDLYRNFAAVWPELLTFIRTTHFTDTADRTPPVGDPFQRER